MYNKVLDIFCAVAEKSSFSKAADSCYMSHTAIIKQMNQLEHRLGVKLFLRSNRGISLTPAGEAFYKDARKIIRFSEAAIKRTQKISRSSPHIIRMGVSALYTAHSFMKIWKSINRDYPSFQLQVVPFQDNAQTLQSLNKQFDFIIGAFNSHLGAVLCQFIQLGEYRFCFAMTRSHPLARRKVLSLDELAGETLMIMQKGHSPINDQIRLTIQNDYPNILIDTIETNYDANTFNRCAENGKILLSLECWDAVHPSLVNVPMAEQYALPYGLVCSIHTEENMALFLQVVRDFLATH